MRAVSILFALTAVGCGSHSVPEPVATPTQAAAPSESSEPAAATLNDDPNGDVDCDRIPNRCDECLDDPEIFNGFEDEDGCPDRSHILLEHQDIVILDRIYFARGQSRVDANSPVVNAVVATMNGNPQIELVGVIGYTAANERNREALGLARATAVRDVLVGLGVAATRLEVRASLADSSLNSSAARDGSVSRRAGFQVVRMDGMERARWTDGAYVEIPVVVPVLPSLPPAHRTRDSIEDRERSGCGPESTLREDAPGCEAGRTQRVMAPTGDEDCDRISNRCDECVVDRETYNGVDDLDGCPDLGDVTLDEFHTRLTTVIAFERNTTRITSEPSSLDVLAETLRANPQIELVGVVGHAQASESRARDLAAERAQIIVAELTRRNTARARLQVGGGVVEGSTGGDPRVTFEVVRLDGEEVAVWVNDHYRHVPRGDRRRTEPAMTRLPLTPEMRTYCDANPGTTGRVLRDCQAADAAALPQH